MAYTVEAGNLSEKVKKEVARIVVASPAVVDEKTWDAIDISAPAVEGHLRSPTIRDYTDDVDYTTLPVNIPLGHAVRAFVGYDNDGDYTEIFTLTVEFIDPDGNSRGTASMTDSVGSGHSSSHTTGEVVLDKEGLWKVHAILEG